MAVISASTPYPSMSIPTQREDNSGGAISRAHYEERSFDGYVSLISCHLEDKHVISCVAKLDSLGVLYSLRSLIKSLLDCGQGNFCGGDAYRLFVEVKLDLELMLNKPTRFLDNIEMTDRIPSLVICDQLYRRDTK
ncbi:hypothetical protein ACHAW5_009995 [Stephanodiscus triporus]|uniref:Uncharacterized protein n=1 Tax=Stephanodiscus triporus TaxID=2934178 RepID=A0ABD3NTW0_9STRA